MYVHCVCLGLFGVFVYVRCLLYVCLLVMLSLCVCMLFMSLCLFVRTCIHVYIYMYGLVHVGVEAGGHLDVHGLGGSGTSEGTKPFDYNFILLDYVYVYTC